MTHPIYVPSRGRVKAVTLQTFAREGIPAKVFVPADEADDYANEYSGSALEIYESPGQQVGIGAVRNEMIEDALADGATKVWMIDDDITETYVDHARASFTDALETLEEELTHWPTVGIGGPMLEVWGKRGMRDVRNGSVYSFFRMDIDGPWRFWDTYLEDADMVLQILLEGRHSLKVHRVGFAASPGGMGAAAGGCSDGYRAGEGVRASERLEDKWAGLLTFPSKVFPNGTKSYRPRQSMFSYPERGE